MGYKLFIFLLLASTVSYSQTGILGVVNSTSGGTTAGGNQRIFIEGQSNAFGKGTVAELTSAPLNSEYDFTVAMPRVYIWNPSSNAYENLKAGVNAQGFSNGFGTEIGLGVRWMQETSSGNLYINKNYCDGCGSASFLQGTTTYNTALGRKQASDTWLSSNGITVTDKAFIWIQGESGVHDSATYTQHLNSIINNKIADGFMSSGVKKMITRIPAGTATDATQTEKAKGSVIATQSNAAGTYYPTPVSTYFINSGTDVNLHMNGKGLLQLAYNCYEIIFNTTHRTAPI